MPRRKAPNATALQSDPPTTSEPDDTEERRRAIAEYIDTLKALIKGFRDKVHF